jgi:hypothetical protein
VLSLLFALTSPALAQDEDPTRVFVSEFQAANEEGASLAALLSGYLNSQLRQHEEMVAIPVSAAPSFGEHSALVYLLSCPPGEYLGCAYVVGDRVDARYAVAGTVEAKADGSNVHVTIIDVWESREALSFDAELGLGDDEAFAAGVAEVLIAVIAGREGRLDDIREMEDPDAESETQDELELARQQLAALSAEIGDVTTLASRSGRGVERPEYTMDDLSRDTQTDAVKPWEQLGMAPGEYIKFKNSGLTVEKWRDLASGRRMQLLLRVGGGYAQGPYSTRYSGWYAIDGSTFEVLEAKAWQAREAASGPAGSAWIGFGVHPAIEVDIGGGLHGGRYSMYIQQEIAGEEPIVRTPDDFGAMNWWVGGRVLGAPLVTKRVRPVVGVGARYIRGEATAQNQTVGDGTGLPMFEGNHLVSVQGTLGGEATLGRYVDVYLHAPVDLIVAGTEPRTFAGQDNVAGTLQSYIEPGAAPIFGGGVEAGITVRVGGRTKAVERPVEDSELEQEGL